MKQDDSLAGSCDLSFDPHPTVTEFRPPIGAFFCPELQGRPSLENHKQESSLHSPKGGFGSQGLVPLLAPVQFRPQIHFSRTRVYCPGATAQQVKACCHCKLLSIAQWHPIRCIPLSCNTLTEPVYQSMAPGQHSRTENPFPRELSVQWCGM